MQPPTACHSCRQRRQRKRPSARQLCVSSACLRGCQRGSTSSPASLIRPTIPILPAPTPASPSTSPNPPPIHPSTHAHRQTRRIATPSLLRERALRLCVPSRAYQHHPDQPCCSKGWRCTCDHRASTSPLLSASIDTAPRAIIPGSPHHRPAAAITIRDPSIDPQMAPWPRDFCTQTAS